LLNFLEDLWIMKESLVIFKRVSSEKINEQLFGGFMSAIESISETLDTSGISNLQIGNKKFYFLKRKNFMFIGNSNESIKEKEILKELNIIANKFFNLFPMEKFENWNGDINSLLEFQKHIKNSLELELEKLKESLW